MMWKLLRHIYAGNSPSLYLLVFFQIRAMRTTMRRQLKNTAYSRTYHVARIKHVCFTEAIYAETQVLSLQI